MSETALDMSKLTLPLDRWSGRDFRQLAKRAGARDSHLLPFWDLECLFRREESYAVAYGHLKDNPKWTIPVIEGPLSTYTQRDLLCARKALEQHYVEAGVVNGPKEAREFVNSLEAEVSKALAKGR